MNKDDTKSIDEQNDFKSKCVQCLKGPKQIIKSAVLLTCTVVVIYQITECMRKLQNPPIATYTHFDINQTINYPALTVCRDPPYKFEVLDKYGLYGHPRFTSEWKYFDFENVDLGDFWAESTYSDKDNVISYGLNKSSDNLIVKNSMHFILGQCQTFFPKTNMKSASKDTGYSITLNHSMKSIGDTPSTIPPGYHIYIHQANENFTELSSVTSMEYLYVNVGEELEVKLSVQEINILPNGPRMCEKDYNYSATGCAKNCAWTELTDTVGCSGPWINSTAPYCKNYTQMKHLIVDYIKLTNNKGSCSCPLRCQSLLYNAFVMDKNSMTIWDSITGQWSLKSGVHEMQTQLYVYFNNMVVSVYEESHSYDWSLFLADFGGSLGFLLGLSVLGVIALLENIFDLFIKPSIRHIRMSNSSSNTESTEGGTRSKKISVTSGTSGNSNYSDNRDILKDYEKFNIKYNEKNFYI